MEMMDMAADDTREELRRKLRSNFDGRIVRKDLTKKIKEGANVPVYVLEFLLGQYCSSDDETIIEQGVQNVKRILADNFVRPDEAQKILSQLAADWRHAPVPGADELCRRHFRFRRPEQRQRGQDRCLFYHRPLRFGGVDLLRVLVRQPHSGVR